MRKWTSRRMAFLAVLISVSIVFIIVGVRLFPPAILPNLRFSVEGLPIKITGLLFGPILGGITAAIADVLSYLFVPGIYSVYYFFGILITGIVPGVVIFVYNLIKKHYVNEAILDRLYRKMSNYSNSTKFNPWQKEQAISRLQVKINKVTSWGAKDHRILKNIYMLSSIAIISITILTINGAIYFIGDQPGVLEKFQWIKNKYVFMALISTGSISMNLILIVGRFYLKLENYLILVPIIIFSAILEPIVVAIVSYGDVANQILPSYEVALVSHILISPIKIWVNTIVIFISYKIISPLVFKKQSNSY